MGQLTVFMRRFANVQKSILPSRNCLRRGEDVCCRRVRLVATCSANLKLHHYQPKVVSSPQHAELFVASLRSQDRSVLVEALEKYEATNEGEGRDFAWSVLICKYDSKLKTLGQWIRCRSCRALPQRSIFPRHKEGNSFGCINICGTCNGRLCLEALVLLWGRSQ